jgi:CBS domain-containing protein
MWEHDCGILPVIDDSDRVVGVITDRDICMSAFTRGQTLGSIHVHDAMASKVFSCHSSDDIELAEELMSKHQIRRLPVINDAGAPIGLISIGDIAREAAAGRKKKSDLKQAIDALASICEPRQRALQAAE